MIACPLQSFGVDLPTKLAGCCTLMALSAGMLVVTQASPTNNVQKGQYGMSIQWLLLLFGIFLALVGGFSLRYPQVMWSWEKWGNRLKGIESEPTRRWYTLNRTTGIVMVVVGIGMFCYAIFLFTG